MQQSIGIASQESRTKFPVLKIVFRVPSPKIPCSNVQGISLKVLVFSALLRSIRSYKWVALKNFPVFFPVTREFGLMRPVRQRLRPPPRSLMQKEICRFLASRPDFAGVRATSKPKKSICNLPIELQGPFRGLCLCPGILRFPTGRLRFGSNAEKPLENSGSRPSANPRGYGMLR